MMSAITHTGEWVRGRPLLSPAVARGVLLLLIVASLAAGLLVDDATACRAAISAAGVDLTRLMRMMAGLKALIAVGMFSAVFWRLGAAVTPARLAAFAVSCGAMAAGPLLIWDMAHIVTGAVLLHGGLLAALMLLWRDPAVSGRLAAMVAARRQRALAGGL